MTLVALMAAPLIIFAPLSSKAGDGDTYYNQQHRERHDAVWEWFRARDVRGREEWLNRDLESRGLSHRPLFTPGRPGDPGNSVPLNEGTVFLLLAGLGLGAKMLYDRRKRVENSVL